MTERQHQMVVVIDNDGFETSALESWILAEALRETPSVATTVVGVVSVADILQRIGPMNVLGAQQLSVLGAGSAAVVCDDETGICTTTTTLGEIVQTPPAVRRSDPLGDEVLSMLSEGGICVVMDDDEPRQVTGVITRDSAAFARTLNQFRISDQAFQSPSG